MSTVYLVPNDPAYDAVGFDVTTAENHTEVSTVTVNPIEDGSVINDHKVDEPATFSATVVVTDYPIKTNFYGDGDTGIIDITVPQFQGRGVVIPSTFVFHGFKTVREANRIKEMQDRLTKLRKDGVLVTVLTSTREYPDMLLAGVDLPRGPKSIGQGTFSLAFQQIKIVQLQTVRAPKPREKRAIPGQAVGAKEGEEDKPQGPNKSWLKKGVDGDYNEALGKIANTFFPGAT